MADEQLAVLWAAWRLLPDVEDELRDDLGTAMASRVLALWALSRIGSGISEEGLSVADLFDDDLRPRFSDWLLEDVAVMAFALGASWARSADRTAPGSGPVAS